MKKLFLLLMLIAFPAHAAESIKIGFLASMTGQANLAHPFANGAIMAQEEINAEGGVMGRKLDLLIRDDKNRPADAVLQAQELVEQKKVPILIGTSLDNLTLAVSAYAKKQKIPFIKPTGGSEKIVWQEGHRYIFMMDVSTDTLGAMLAETAAQNPGKRWAVLIPNYEYGHAMYASFQKKMKKLRPDVEWVSEQVVNVGKIDAASTVQAVNRAKPDAVLALIFGSDLVQFNRDAKARGYFKDTLFVAPYFGWPEFQNMFGKESPVGWLTQGFPYLTFDKPELKNWVQRYKKRFGDYPGAGSMDTYISVRFAAEAIKKAHSLDREAITDALKGLAIATPVGPLTMRAQDNQATYGAWIGKTGFVNGVPTITDWTYKTPAPYFPSDAEIKKLRPKE